MPNSLTTHLCIYASDDLHIVILLWLVSFILVWLCRFVIFYILLTFTGTYCPEKCQTKRYPKSYLVISSLYLRGWGPSASAEIAKCHDTSTETNQSTPQ